MNNLLHKVTCYHCKQNGHKFHECLQKKIQRHTNGGETKGNNMEVESQQEEKEDTDYEHVMQEGNSKHTNTLGKCSTCFSFLRRLV